MNQKGDGNTFWVIIGAVIALVVLIVLLLIFTGKTGMLETGLMNCESKGGFCILGSSIESTTDLDKRCRDQCGPTKTYVDCSYSSIFSCTSGNVCCLGVKRSPQESK